jgi:hypothetical protein
VTPAASGRRAVVIVASTRAADGTYEDRTGPLLVATLTGWGYAVPPPVVVGDGDPVGEALVKALSSGPSDKDTSVPDVILTTGGTGSQPDRRHPGADPAVARAGAARHTGAHPWVRGTPWPAAGRDLARAGRRGRPHPHRQPARIPGRGARRARPCSSRSSRTSSSSSAGVRPTRRPSRRGAPA